MDGYEIAVIVVAVLGIVFGGVFALKWKQAVNLLRELGEAFTHTAEALEDKKLTKDEAVKCLKEWKDVYIAVMLLIGKK